MTSGNIQLRTSTGNNNIHITGNPQITFFQAVYRRHTNFAIEAISISGNTSPNDKNSIISYQIPKGQILLSNMWIEAKLSQLSTDTTASYCNWTNNTGAALIKECEFSIGGQSIERHTSLWYDVSNELMDHDNKEYMGLTKHVSKNTYLKSNSNKLPSLHLNIPLKFWFNRNIGQALPVCALQKNEVKMKITYRDYGHLVNKSSDSVNPITFTQPDTESVKLYADYIHLDTDELRRFTQMSHEYLIDQVQIQEDTLLEKNVKLNFSHPVKELIWVIRQKNVFEPTDGRTGGLTTVDATQNNNVKVDESLVSTTQQSNDYFNYSILPVTTGGGTASDFSLGNLYGCNYAEWFSKAKLQVNNTDRFTNRNPYYFRTIQPIQAGHKVPSKHIYCYSFAINPEEQQPSGTINYSRVDSSFLVFDNIQGIGEGVANNTKYITIFAVFYNVLRIQGGVGGLAYSN